MMFGDFDTAHNLSKEHTDIEFSVLPMPQVKGIAQKVYYADYWGETVNKNAKYPKVAWDLLKFIATNEKAQKIFTEEIQRPNSLQKSSEMGFGFGENWQTVFAQQTTDAKSWYKGTNPQKVDQEFLNMINLVVNNGQQPQAAVDTAAENIKKFWKQ